MYRAIIDSDFCKNHYMQKPSPPNNDLEADSEALKNWKEVNAFLLSVSHISFLKKPFASVDELAYDNPILYKLLNDYWGGRKSNLEIVNELPVEAVKEASYLSTFYFVDSFSLGYSPSEHGMIVYESKNVSDRWIANPSIPKKYLITGNDIISNAITKWDDIAQFTHQTDSIVISDNYVFRSRNYENNFIPLLRSLLPIDSKTEVNLTVITKELYPVSPKNARKEIQVELKKLYEEVSKLINAKIPNLKIKLSIVKKTTNDFHDRGIITRYFRIELSNSINFFDKHGRKIGPSDVTFAPEPHVALNGQKTYGEFAIKQLNDLKKLIDSGKCESINYMSNPLLEVSSKFIH